jgi:hypothetical protein
MTGISAVYPFSSRKLDYVRFAELRQWSDNSDCPTERRFDRALGALNKQIALIRKQSESLGEQTDGDRRRALLKCIGATHEKKHEISSRRKCVRLEVLLRRR